jgi:hypothetical protein
VAALHMTGRTDKGPVGIRRHTSEHTSGEPDNTVSPVRKVLVFVLVPVTSFLSPDAPEDDDSFYSVKFPCSVPPLRDFSGLRFTLEKIKEKGKEPPSLLSLPSSQDSAQHSAAVNLVLPARCLVVRSRRLPSHRVTHPQISDRTASCAHRKPHGRGGSGFHIPDSPSVTSGVFPRQGGGRASINSTR